MHKRTRHNHGKRGNKKWTNDSGRPVHGRAVLPDWWSCFTMLQIVPWEVCVLSHFGSFLKNPAPLHSNLPIRLRSGMFVLGKFVNGSILPSFPTHSAGVDVLTFMQYGKDRCSPRGVKSLWQFLASNHEWYCCYCCIVCVPLPKQRWRRATSVWVFLCSKRSWECESWRQCARIAAPK